MLNNVLHNTRGVYKQVLHLCMPPMCTGKWGCIKMLHWRYKHKIDPSHFMELKQMSCRKYSQFHYVENIWYICNITFETKKFLWVFIKLCEEEGNVKILLTGGVANILTCRIICADILGRDYFDLGFFFFIRPIFLAFLFYLSSLLSDVINKDIHNT